MPKPWRDTKGICCCCLWYAFRSHKISPNQPNIKRTKISFDLRENIWSWNANEIWYNKQLTLNGSSWVVILMRAWLVFVVCVCLAVYSKCVRWTKSKMKIVCSPVCTAGHYLQSTWTRIAVLCPIFLEQFLSLLLFATIAAASYVCSVPSEQRTNSDSVSLAVNIHS